MIDNFMVERWNVIDSAAMAVSVEGLLYRIINKKPHPFDFDDALDRGIDFLEEARDGGAIICGTPEASGFTGTLSPLSWSTDAYIEIKFKPEKSEKRDQVYKQVVSTLKEYKLLLESIKKGDTLESFKDKAQSAHGFFRTLADVLMKQADPTTTTYSHEAL